MPSPTTDSKLSIAVTAAALSEDPAAPWPPAATRFCRPPVRRCLAFPRPARPVGQRPAGIQPDADVSEDVRLVGLSADLGARGWPGADVDRALERLDRVLEAAKGLSAPLVRGRRPPAAGRGRSGRKPTVTQDMAGLLILPGSTALSAVPHSRRRICRTRPPPLTRRSCRRWTPRWRIWGSGPTATASWSRSAPIWPGSPRWSGAARGRLPVRRRSGPGGPAAGRVGRGRILLAAGRPGPARPRPRRRRRRRPADQAAVIGRGTRTGRKCRRAGRRGVSRVGDRGPVRAAGSCGGGASRVGVATARVRLRCFGDAPVDVRLQCRP